MSATGIRNIAIICALAAVVMVVPGGGNASDAILQTLVVAMLSALAFFTVRLYRERRDDLYRLGDRNRAILYGSIGLAVFAVVAAGRMMEGPGGTLAWLALVCLAGYGVLRVIRAAREY